MKKLILALALFAFTLADNLIDVDFNKHAPSPDARLKRLQDSHAPDVAYYIDARTGEIFLVQIPSLNTKPQKISKTAPLKKLRSSEKCGATKDTKEHSCAKCNPPRIPYEMQEERIELLP